MTNKERAEKICCLPRLNHMANGTCPRCNAIKAALDEVQREAYKQAENAFKDAYSNYDDPLIGTMYGIKAMSNLAKP